MIFVTFERNANDVQHHRFEVYMSERDEIRSNSTFMLERY